MNTPSTNNGRRAPKEGTRGQRPIPAKFDSTDQPARGQGDVPRNQREGIGREASCCAVRGTSHAHDIPGAESPGPSKALSVVMVKVRNRFKSRDYYARNSTRIIARHAQHAEENATELRLWRRTPTYRTRRAKYMRAHRFVERMFKWWLRNRRRLAA